MLRRAGGGAPGADVLGFDGQSACGGGPGRVPPQGLMAGHKLVVVDNADAFVRGRRARCWSDTAPDPATRPRCCSGPSGGTGKLDDAIARVGAVPSAMRTPAEAAAWVVEHARDAHAPRSTRRRDGSSIASGPTAGGSPARWASSRSRRPGAIVAALVEQLVGDTREDEAWAFQDVLLGAQPEPILASLRRLLDNAPRETAVLVTIVMIDLARKLHAMGAALAAGESARTAAGRLKIWPFERAGVLAERAGRASPARLRALYHAAIEADVRQKSGLGKPSRTLERLALRFASL